MNCGDSHGIDCSEVLDQMYEYLHHELDDDRLTLIERHINDCGPCLAEYDLEEMVKELVNRSCHCTPAPGALRGAIVARIAEIRVDGSA